MDKMLTVAQINQTIQEQLADKQTVQALLTTTFNGMSEPIMRQAMLEGMMRGFTFQDFLQKDVYAIPYGSKYSLVTSIDYMRKVAAQNGLAGKDEPTYEDEENGKPRTCSVTVKRVVNGAVCDFTAKVYFSEYNTGKNQWVSKPRTMIAKVAEMHALRMAFPEELSKSYLEDEISPIKADAEVIDYDAIREQFDRCTSADEVRSVFAKLPKSARGDAEVVAMGKKRKEEIESEISDAVIDDEIPIIEETV